MATCESDGEPGLAFARMVISPYRELLGLVRQYLPKQSDFTNVSQADLETIMDKLNHRPRKCLDFRSPFQVFFQQPVALGS